VEIALDNIEIKAANRGCRFPTNLMVPRGKQNKFFTVFIAELNSIQ
jgi:hypothetical protein